MCIRDRAGRVTTRPGKPSGRSSPGFHVVFAGSLVNGLGKGLEFFCSRRVSSAGLLAFSFRALQSSVVVVGSTSLGRLRRCSKTLGSASPIAINQVKRLNTEWFSRSASGYCSYSQSKRGEVDGG